MYFIKKLATLPGLEIETRSEQLCEQLAMRCHETGFGTPAKRFWGASRRQGNLQLIATSPEQTRGRRSAGGAAVGVLGAMSVQVAAQRGWSRSRVIGAR